MTTKSKETGEILAGKEDEDFRKRESEMLAKEKEGNVTEEIELKNELFKVKGSLRHNITADYTLGHLSKDEREFITENYQNAEFAKSILTRFQDKGYNYEFDNEKMDWKKNSDGVPAKIRINDNEKNYIKALANRTFEFFMVKPHMIAILGRNRSENFIVKLLGKHKDDNEDEMPMAGMTQKSFLDKMKERMSGVEYVEE